MDKEKRPIPSSFTVSLIGGFEPTTNPMVSKARVATFRKGKNRNRSFFTNEVAQQIIDRVIGTPVVGFYSNEEKDYTKHVPVKQGQVYGYVPENHNFAWEDREEADGTLGNYACFDVHVLTGRFEEAKEILGKGQSMELDPATIDGDWRVIGGQEYFVYDSAQLSGLCVLGDKYDPCFTGSAFFSIENKDGLIPYLNTVREGIAQFMQENFAEQDAVEQKLEGGTTQMKLNFGWAEGDVREALFSHLNPNFTEEASWLIDSIVLGPIDENSYISYRMADGNYTVTTIKTNEEEEVVYESRDVEFYSYQTQEEREALASAVAELETVKAEFEAYKVENTKDEPEEVDNSAFMAELETAKARIVELEESLAAFTAKAAEEEEARKAALIESYSTLLPEGELQEITESQANFTYDEIEAKLAVSYMREQRKGKEKVPASSFTNKNNPGDELVALLSRYKK